MTTTWRKELTEALAENKEGWGDVEANTMTASDMDTEFYSGYGGSEGCAFTVWTKHFVYFPVVYDGSEWVGCVSRNPDGKPTQHQGGQ